MKFHWILSILLLNELLPASVSGQPIKEKRSVIQKRSTSGDLARAAVLGAVSAVAYTAAAKGISKVSQKLHGGGHQQQNYEQYPQQPPMNRY